jgi:hypothetical protein
MSPELLREITVILREAEERLLLVVTELAQPITDHSSLPEWMTLPQLAEYWQMRNKKGEVTTAGILKWTRRRPDEFPLPHAYMGDRLRFHRDDVDRWAREEAERRRVQNERRHLAIA